MHGPASCSLRQTKVPHIAERGREERGLRVEQNEKPLLWIWGLLAGNVRGARRNAGPRTYWNARGGQVFLTPAEHLLCRRQGELSRLSLNFRIVVAADLDPVAINAKSGSQRAAPRSHRPVGDGCVGVASPGRLKQNRDGRSFRPDGHPEIRSLEQGHVGSLDLIPETDN